MGMGVTITINRMPIEEISIVRRGTFIGNNKFHVYRIKHDEKIYFIRHLYSDGALVLAKLALEAVINGK